ncbi:MAG: SPOR domain-containing protein [Sulfuricella denitrificans]|nr:SPOR domain-containing protein [Sulfuricella denitrificans]
MPAPKGYVVQLGLFSNYENAVQLQKRLADHGIKSYTETRLHVGPFQNKTEADQAMAKIRSMGINAVLAPAH